MRSTDAFAASTHPDCADLRKGLQAIPVQQAQHPREQSTGLVTA